jgi:hypothetical protein
VLLGHALQFRFQALELGHLVFLRQALLDRDTITLDPLVQAPSRHPEPSRNFFDGEPALGDLANRFNLELFRELLVVHDTS